MVQEHKAVAYCFLNYGVKVWRSNGFAFTAVACEVLRYEKREQVARFKLCHAVNAMMGAVPITVWECLICESDGSAKKDRKFEG